ncbi:WhiB family transcriptional regulator [Mycobacterium sp. OTB74]|uniref:WhiB family transcriptional regulator n=1 Tax=Mycobacterium sp. OTB74 TaxID=1853452 RepID=UPI00247680FF|nr:WhiB family transcriptional regulator [Mycobacterium sp. OTB74]MDH6247990.1 WhiB family redox-sensing transcriptional regulator [Mycobacterium sp. OTB74]
MTGILTAAAHFPVLPGAACRGRSDLFDQRPDRDPDRDRVEAQALALCRCCPALGQCREWFDALPARDRPAGVVAGQVNRRRYARAGR